MDRFHPERATRLSAKQKKYAKDFGEVLSKAKNGDDFGIALAAIAECRAYKRALVESHAVGWSGCQIWLGGLRHAVRKWLSEADVDDLCFFAIHWANLGIALTPMAMGLHIKGKRYSKNDIFEEYGGGMIEYATHVWERSGRKIYCVAPGLSWRLNNTELRGVRSCDFRLPYRCVYMDLSILGEKGFPAQIEDKNGKGVAEGAYVIEDVIDGVRVVHIEVVSTGGSGGAMASGALPHGSVFRSYPWHLTVRLRDGSMVQDCLDDLVRLIEADFCNEPGQESSGRDLAYQVEVARSIFGYIMNVIMYATIPGVDARVVPCNPDYQSLFDRAMMAPEGSKKRRSLLDRANGGSNQRMTLLGGNLYVDKGKERSEPGNGTGGKITVRTLAAGHWKHVAHGAGRKERRLTWIEPYWRGPELGPVSEKKHVLTDRSSRGRM